MTTKKIVITGGHVTPAIAVIEKIQETKHCQIVFIGRKFATEKNSRASLEYNLVTEKGIKFYDIKSPKISRERLFGSLFTLPRFFVALFESYKILLKEKPDCIVSFGGYLALPVCIAAKLMSIPILTHEQTVTLGLANSIIAKIANTVCVSWPESIENKKIHNLVLTGNPIRSEFFKEPKKPNFWPSDNAPILYVTGGNLGSHVINEIVLKDIEDLLSKYNIIHQTGNITEFHDFENLENKKKILHEKLKRRYVIRMHMSAQDVVYTLKHADLLIGRSGANTVSEIIMSAIPSILIPLPWAGGNEQEKQADYIQKNGLGKKISQEKLTSHTLNTEIVDVLTQKETIKKAFSKVKERKLFEAAAENIVKEIDALMIQ